MHLPWPSRAPKSAAYLGGTARLHALHALAALQMHQPATAELIRKTDEQTDALLRQKKLLQAMACFHRLHSAAHQRAPAPAVPMDARVRTNPVALARRTRHRGRVSGTLCGYTKAARVVGAVADVTQDGNVRQCALRTGRRRQHQRAAR